jgi:5-methylthioadenosine/S-adenosylhomocysteine deaminase
MTYTDMYYFEDIEAETAKEAGVRGVLGQTIIGFPAPDYKTWNESIAATGRYIQRFRNDDLIVPAVAPHAIYTTPDEALTASHNLAVKYGIPLLIHLSETKTERLDALAKRKMTPTQALEKLGVLDGRVVAAHCVWEDDNDLRILKRHGTGVAHCPSSNTKLASGIAPVTEMLKIGLNVGLGNDGFAGSNDTADLILEMNLAAKLQKVNVMDPAFFLPSRSWKWRRPAAPGFWVWAKRSDRLRRANAPTSSLFPLRVPMRFRSTICILKSSTQARPPTLKTCSSTDAKL